MAEIIKPWIASADGKKAVHVESCLCLIVEESGTSQFDLSAFHLSEPSGKVVLGTFASLADATKKLQEYVTATAR